MAPGRCGSVWLVSCRKRPATTTTTTKRRKRSAVAALSSPFAVVPAAADDDALTRSDIARRRSGKRATSSYLLSLCLLVVIAGDFTVSGEPLHHSRSYKDEFSLDPPRRVFGVKTFEQGLKYLVKYGWVNCTLTLNNYQEAYSDMLLGSDPNTRAREGVATRPLCTEEEAQKGYKAMQQYYKLPETGTLDDNTLRLMNSKRCGNRDAGDGKKDEPPSAIPTAGTGSTAASKTRRSSRVRRAALGEIERRKAEEERVRAQQQAMPPPHGSVILGRLLTQTKTSAISSRLRRQQLLSSYIQDFQKEDIRQNKGRRRKRRSVADVINQAARQRVNGDADLHERTVRRRGRRSAMVTLNDAPEIFNKAIDECVTWRIPSICYSRRIPAEDQRGVVRLAFRMWSEVIPLCFEEQRDGYFNDVDIQICFAKDTHLNCDIPFDGSGGELAHSWKLGNIHFDDAENYRPTGAGGIDLLRVAVHEIGHVLGLNHTERKYSVMYSIYVPLPVKTDFELGWEDRKDVQKYYGVCKGKFDTVFDWIRLSVTQGLIYNTYFFRDTMYWMYENRYNRTRYGDPLVISNEWKGVPGNVDAYTQVILWNQDAYRWDITTLFFKGDKFYVFNSKSDSVETGLKISDRFGPKNDSSDSIPNNLDSIFFDIRSKKMQFFKGDWVYIYDPAGGTNNCCEQKVKFTDLYPTPEGKALTGNVDAVYFSHTYRKQYFFKDEFVWVNDGTALSQTGSGGAGTGQAPNKLHFVKEWYDVWYDICDVGNNVIGAGAGEVETVPGNGGNGGNAGNGGNGGNAGNGGAGGSAGSTSTTASTSTSSTSTASSTSAGSGAGAGSDGDSGTGGGGSGAGAVGGSEASSEEESEEDSS